jgi:hypothetical protein
MQTVAKRGFLKLPLHRRLIVPLFCLSALLSPALANAGTSITGCAVSTPPAVTLQNEGDHQTYDLLGDPATIKVNQRAKFSGKKRKDSSGKRYFVVGKLEKNYGPCKVSPTVP